MEPVDLKSRRMLEEFESQGETGVRQALAQQLFGPDAGAKVRLAQDWLGEQERLHDEFRLLGEAKVITALAAIFVQFGTFGII